MFKIITLVLLTLRLLCAGTSRRFPDLTYSFFPVCVRITKSSRLPVLLNGLQEKGFTLSTQLLFL